LEKEVFSEFVNTKTTIVSKKIKIKMFNESDNVINDLNSFKGFNKISILNSKLITNYNFTKNLLSFESKESQIKNSKVDYTGKLNLDPFYLNLDIEIEKIRLKNFFNSRSILLELFKTNLLFNNNISANISVDIYKIPTNKLFNSAEIILNINNGKINFNGTKLNNEKIGSLKITNSQLFFENDNLVLNNELTFSLKNSRSFYSFLHTPKKLRKPINNIFIEYKHNFFDNEIIIKNFKIDNKKLTENNKNILDNFNDSKNNNLQNLIKNRNFFNKLLDF
jgi:hypothetical protein